MKGHLRQRGNAWELRAYVGVDPFTNRKKYLTRTFRGGKREAEEALARFTTEVAGGGHAAQDTTVGDLILDWLSLARADLSWESSFSEAPDSANRSLLRSAPRKGRSGRQATLGGDCPPGACNSPPSASSSDPMGVDRRQPSNTRIATAP